jgi:hypothetical protein
MPEPARVRLVDLVLLLVLLAAAAGARVGYLSTYANHAENAGPFVVQETAPPEELLQNMKEGQWFAYRAPLSGAEEPAGDLSPGYAWLLGELKRFSVPESVVRWIQCALSTLTVGFYFLFARWAFPGRTVAVLTGLLCALHPFWIINTAALNDGTLAAFLLGGCVWLGSRGGQVGGPLTSLLYGLGLAALALVRAALLPFALVALIWFLWRSRRLAGGWLPALLAFLGFLIGLAPWTVRNAELYHDAFPIVDSTFYHLWMGNNPQATGGPLSEEELVQALVAIRGGDVDATKEWLATLEQPQRYRALAGPLLEEVQRSAPAALQRRLWAGLYFFFGADWFKAGGTLWREQSVEGGDTELFERSPFRGLLTGSLFMMLVLGGLGWRWTYGWRREAMPSSQALMWVPLPYLLGHAEALSGPRLPLDGVLLSYAAFAVVFLLPRVGEPLRAGSHTESEAAT